MHRQLKILVSGRVQGVYYRGTCQKKAQQLGITGFTRNLSDGRVEIVAEGPGPVLELLIGWCRQGPKLARVDKLTVDEVNTGETFHHFEIR